MIRYFTNLAKKTLKTGVVIGGLITAYQASQKTKKQGGSFKWDKFVGNFKTQAAKNIKLTADFTKGLIGKYYDGYRVSDKGENGYAYKNADPESDKVSEVFDTIREYAPDVIDKVENFVDDIRENAPEYKAKAQEFVEDVKEAAIKALELDSDAEKAEKVKKPAKVENAETAEAAVKVEETAEEAKPEKAETAEKAVKVEETAEEAKPEKTEKAEKAEKPVKARKPRTVKKADKKEE